MELLVLDAWTVFRSDIKYGNSVDFGNFELCKSIHHQSEDGDTLSGQFCFVQFRTSHSIPAGIPPKRSLFNYGWKDLDTRFGAAICIPASCPSDIIQPLMGEVFRDTKYEIATDYDQERYCKKPSEPFRVTGSMIALGCVLAALLLLASFATVHDLETLNQQKDRNRLLVSFSFYSNARSLFSLEQEKSAESIGCLHGIRVASTLTIILFHSYYHRTMYPLAQSDETTSFLKSNSERWIIALMTTVESFFVLSGFLAFRSIVRDLDK